MLKDGREEVIERSWSTELQTPVTRDRPHHHTNLLESEC